MYAMRPLYPSDLDLVCAHRTRMFAEADYSPECLAAMAEPFRRWVKPRLDDQRYFGWAIEGDGAVIAGLGMIVIDWPPHPWHPGEDRRGYILNVFVEPTHRRAGLASRLMKAAYEEAKRRNIGLMALHATEVGRLLYERLGWTASAEMVIAVR